MFVFVYTYFAWSNDKIHKLTEHKKPMPQRAVCVDSFISVMINVVL